MIAGEKRVEEQGHQSNCKERQWKEEQMQERDQEGGGRAREGRRRMGVRKWALKTLKCLSTPRVAPKRHEP